MNREGDGDPVGEKEQVRRELERSGRYRLYLWPPHCLQGGDGHSLVGVIQEARLFFAYARKAPAGIEIKGGHPLTENYSALSPEVLLAHDGSSASSGSRMGTARGWS